MPTRDVSETIQARLKRDPELCRLTLRSALEELLDGEVEVAKAMLRDYVIARMGYVGLGTLTGKTPQSLARMLGRTGNPQTRNLFEVIRVLQEHEGVRAKVRFTKRTVKEAA